ncbi:uncharacterized protein LOC131168464 isoform X2 [Malania oleifera]|uniref:uncharacterized protein LOC131168464 isoform X2 n=1 Tax=Malania oleifera TaxID=397392 RepID=UPI0025AE2553|nr:uncharacterized protein LOC131168464 isoform X2 [Malania oleifera]
MDLVVTSDTTALSYWLNWRVLLCAIWVLTPMVIASYIIWKYEVPNHWKSADRAEAQQKIAHSLYNDETWRPCIKQIHPIWLFSFRIMAFSLLLVILIIDLDVHGAGMFYYYTQLSFFSFLKVHHFGSVLSIYGCYQYHRSWRDFNGHRVETDAEQGSYVPLAYREATTIVETGKNSCAHEENHFHERSGVCKYVFQVMFQMSAGAVMLTDCIYWFIIFPFLTIKDYNLNFLTVIMHSVNAVMLLGDTALNCLPLPWFRITYFILWTGFFVIFQWIIHACVTIWWPYPFLDLSSPNAPLWYLLVALMHIPCYGVFALIVKLKHYLLSTYFPQSYQCAR